MLIRLRLTLLYSAILALTLGIFGVALYSVQANSTLDAIRQALAKSSDLLTRSLTITLLETSEGFSLFQLRLPPGEKEPFPGGQVFADVREREMVRVLDSQGKIVASPMGTNLDPLPINQEGLQALQDGSAVWQIGLMNNEELLVYSRPISVDGELVFILQVARPLAERSQSLAALSQTLIVASLLTVLLAFGIGWFFAGAALRPIQRITQTAQTIGAESDFSRRVDYRGPNDEVGQLAGTFNAMLARLQEAYQRVSRALRLQRNFVADVSHELRTPLTTVRGNLALLRRNPPPAERDDILKDIEEESDRLIRLVNSLLVLARADASQEALPPAAAPEMLPLRPLVEEVARQARALDEQREIAEVCGEMEVRAERDTLKQILLILLDNALKHSTGTITLSAALVEQQAPHKGGRIVRLSVQDEGPGIPTEVLPHVFERFYRGDGPAPSAGKVAAGFGLGLPIARALVERLGGTISLHSAPGEGTRVDVTLPGK